MKTFALLFGFDQSKIVGRIEIDESIIDQFERGAVFGIAPGIERKENGEVELIEISLIDTKHIP